MDIKSYQALAMRTSPEGHDRVLNGCLGLIGESGEIVDVIKKWLFQSGEAPTLPKDRLIEECGDLFWYCMETITGVGEKCNEAWLHWKMMPSKNDRIEADAARIAKEAALPFYMKFCEGDVFNTNYALMEQIREIMLYTADFLKKWCDCSPEDCMEKNIEKLRKRYPDGFDPERSMHRD